jgi:hypothetical protein
MARYHASTALALLVALCLILPRFVNLGADPAPSVPAEVLTDEGWWWRNARQAVLFGATPLDEFNQAIHVAPVHDALLTLAFSTGGVSFESARIVSAAAGVLTIVALLWIVGSFSDRRVAFWCAILLGFSAPFLLHNRTAFVESTLILVISLTVASTGAALKRPLFFALAGAFTALAFWTKPNAAYIGALPILAAIRPPSGIPARAGRSILIFGGGLALVFLPIAALVVAPDPRAWFDTNRLIAEGYATGGWASLPAGILSFPRNRFWGEAAPIAALGAAMLLMELRQAPGSAGRSGPEEIIAWLARRWLVLASLGAMVLPYQPIRKMLTLLPPLCLLAAHFLARRPRGHEPPGGGSGPGHAASPVRLWLTSLLLIWPTASLVWGGVVVVTVLHRGAPPRWALGGDLGQLSAIAIIAGSILLATWAARALQTAAAQGAWTATLATVAGSYPLWMAMRWILGRWGEFGGDPWMPALRGDLIMTIGIVPLAAAALLRFARARRAEFSADPAPPRWPRLIASPGTFLVLFGLANVPSLLALARPSWSMRNGSWEIERALPPGSVLVGPFADTLGLETSLHTVEARPHFHMNAKPFERWPDAALLTAARHELVAGGETLPPWAPPDLEPILDLPLCPNPWTGRARFVLRLRARRHFRGGTISTPGTQDRGIARPAVRSRSSGPSSFCAASSDGSRDSAPRGSGSLRTP